MTIECKECGGPTMPETVIKLRRGVLGMRETRWQGTYCATCRVCSSPDLPAASPSFGITALWRQKLGGYAPVGFAGVGPDVATRAC